MLEIAPPTWNELSYDDAISYCKNINYKGYNDWRLPTKYEYCYYGISGWYKGRSSFYTTYCVTPVRNTTWLQFIIHSIKRSFYYLEKAPKSTNNMTYEEAVLYCQFLEYNGHRDWRLPTQIEYRNHTYIRGWRIDDTNGVIKWCVTPVRETTKIRYIKHWIKQNYVRICILFKKIDVI